MLPRLRLLLAMSLLCLGAWFAALAMEDYVPGATPGSQSGASSKGRPLSPDGQQFISFLTRERFVAEAAPTTKSQVKSPPHAKPQTKSQPEAKSQGAGNTKPIEKRRAASAAQLPWPLNLFGE